MTEGKVALPINFASSASRCLETDVDLLFSSLVAVWPRAARRVCLSRRMHQRCACRKLTDVNYLDLKDILGKRLVDFLALGLVLHGGLGVALPERGAVCAASAIQPCFRVRSELIDSQALHLVLLHAQDSIDLVRVGCGEALALGEEFVCACFDLVLVVLAVLETMWARASEWDGMRDWGQSGDERQKGLGLHM